MNARRSPSRFVARSRVAPADVLAASTRRPGDRIPDPVDRATRTGAAVDAVPDGWQWPRWLDRQLRPTHPAHVAPGASGLVENVTGRDWRTIGTLSSGPLASVDPRGLVTPIAGGWSLDWLVGAEDRWHRPAHDAGVRQRAIAQAPVIETLCRVPSGDAIHRVFALNAGADLGDVVVVEIENASPVPFAVAFALRPADLLGAGSISSIVVDEDRVQVDDRPVLVFDKRPLRWAAGDATVDSMVTVANGAAAEEPFGPVSCVAGLAQAAFVLPVPHRATVRCVLRPHAARRQRPSIAAKLPDAGTVARGWTAHAERGARIELPDSRLDEAYASAVRSLLLTAAAGDVPAPAGREDDWRVEDETRIVRALVRSGFSSEAATVLKRCCDEFELDSWLRREDPSLARNNAIMRTVAELWRLTRDRATVDALVAPVVKAAHWNERYRSRNSAAIDATIAYACHDALTELSVALGDVGQPDAAEDVAAFAARFVLDFDERPRTAQAAAFDADGRLALSALGIDTVGTIDAAARIAGDGDEDALATVGWLTEVGGTVLRWPTHVSHRLGSGTAGAGDDPLAAAAVVDLVRAFVVSPREDNGLALLPLVPAAWFGQPVDVHGVPTAAGTLSFALRWHGARPALLWELEPHEGGETHGVRLTAPGLDPAWSTDQLKGETLLAAPEAHPAPASPIDPGSSFA